VRKSLAILAVLALLGISMSAGSGIRQARPAAATAPMSVDEVLKTVRADLQGQRADIMAKNLTLTSAEAAKFWPAFETYQKQQNAIMDEQMRGIQRYVESLDTLDDAGALALIKAHLDKDEKMTALRKQWLGEFQKVIGTKQAVRAVQIDRRISLAHQIEFASRIPLVH
jgi:Spy/CpxP family protein refolding chaperone